MDSRQKATHDALYQIDPELAGLFARGCELAGRATEPGVQYLLGHVGRELSKAVLSVIAQELPTTAEGEEPGDVASIYEGDLRGKLASILSIEQLDPRIDSILDLLGDDHRNVIARALSLDRGHPLVTSWLHLQRELVSQTHYRKRARRPNPEKVRSCFLQLAGLLFTRVGPYFHAQEDLDRLLAVAEPSEDDLARLREFLVRPQLRFRFFKELRNSKWLTHLHRMKAFDHPPEWVRAGNGYRLTGWLEGETLIRFASDEPEIVVKALLSIPRTHENPVVWSLVAKAIASLPIGYGRRLVSLLAVAPRTPGVRFFNDDAIEATSHLASQGDRSTFKLAKSLLGLRPPPPDDGPAETRWARRRSQAILERLDAHELHDLLGRPMDAMAAVDPVETWSLLLDRLRRAMTLLSNAGYEDDLVSQHWCDSLESSDDKDDPRGQLAVAALRVARRMGTEDPASIERLLVDLPRNGSILRRMRIALLAEFGDHVQAQLDNELADRANLDPPFGATEISLMLRKQFSNASSGARNGFVSNIEAGPGDAELRAIAEFQGEDPDSAAAREKALADWQSRRLRWFHGQIPVELEAIATRLGVKRSQPSNEEKALDEVGFYVGPTGFVAERSPKTHQELTTMSDSEVLAYLESWRPDVGQFDSPSRRGLANAFQSLIATECTRRAGLIADIGRRDAIHPTYLQATLAGLRAFADKPSIPWAHAFTLTLETLGAAERGRDGPNVQDWSWARSEAIDLVEDACTNDWAPTELTPEVLRIVDSAVRSSTKWHRPFPSTIDGFNDVMMAAINTDAGKVTNLSIAAALWVYRAGSLTHEDLVLRFRPWLEAARQRTDDGRIAARAQIGAFLPQVMLIDLEWFTTNEEDLLGSGMKAPLENPTWGGYLTMARLLPDSFKALRGWLARHAAGLPDLVGRETDESSSEREWAVSRHYLDKVAGGYLRGWVTLLDSDRLLELVFDHVPTSERSHFYWEVFRGWSDGEQAPPKEFIDRLLELWRWRLSTVESGGSEAHSDEADGMAWLVMTPHLPGVDALSFAIRSLRAAPRRLETWRHVWARLAELSRVDPPAVIEMAERLVDGELAGDWPHFDFDTVAPVLRVGLTGGQDLKDRTERVVHRLGDKGWTEFGRLLSA